MYTYLASPYSSRATTPELRWTEMCVRFYAVMHALQWMTRKQLWAYSPIVHCHEMASRYTFPTDNDFWKTMNRAFIRPADSVTILCIPGWRESSGVDDERKFALEIEKPLYFLHVITGENLDYDLHTWEPKD